MKKILISEFEHTLYKKNKLDLSNIKSINAFQNNQGVFGVYTDYNINRVNKILSKNKDKVNYDFIIGCHGAIIKTKTGQEISKIDPFVVDDIVKETEKYKNKIKYIYPDEEYKDSILQFHVKQFLKMSQVKDNNQVCMLTIKLNNIYEAKELYEKLQNKYANNIKIVKEDKTISITNNDATINKALKKLKEQYQTEKVYTVSRAITNYDINKNYTNFVLYNNNRINSELADYTVNSIDKVIEIIEQEK